MPIELAAAPEVLTTPDVAELLRVSEATVRRLQSARRIPFHKVGGCIRFAKDDIVSYLSKQRVDAIG